MANDDKVLVHIPKPGGGYQTYEVQRESSSPHQPSQTSGQNSNNSNNDR